MCLKGLSHRFDGVQALTNFNLTVASGERICLIGPNGSGKSTLLNAISGHLRPQTGEILWEGKNLVGRPSHQIARLGIGRKFQTPALFDSMTVSAHLAVAQWARAKTPNTAFVSAGVPEFLLAQLEPNAIAGQLSHGQRQKLELALILATGPRLLLLDEPTAGLSQTETAETVTLLRTLQNKTSVGMLIVEHDMRFVEALEARVVVMMNGALIADGSYDYIRVHPEVRQAYLGQQG